jgi:hypothetical protein
MSKKADKEIVVPMSVDVDGAPTSYGPDDKKAPNGVDDKVVSKTWVFVRRGNVNVTK